MLRSGRKTPFGTIGGNKIFKNNLWSRVSEITMERHVTQCVWNFNVLLLVLRHGN